MTLSQHASTALGTSGSGICEPDDHGGVQKEATRQELVSHKGAGTSSSPAAPSTDAAAATVADPAQAAAAPDGSETPAAPPAAGAGAGAGTSDAHTGEGTGGGGGAAPEADADEAAELEEEVKSLRKVIADLADRAQELKALQDQVQFDVLPHAHCVLVVFSPRPVDSHPASDTRSAVKAYPRVDMIRFLTWPCVFVTFQ